MTGTACVPMASASATAWACLNPTEGGSISIKSEQKTMLPVTKVSQQESEFGMPLPTTSH